jgi:putative transposase
MPRNLKRYYGAGDLHFITCSCYQRQPILGTPHRRDLFLSVLEHMRQQYRFVVLGYVVMPEHFHLLMSEPQLENPSTVLQALKISFARRVLISERVRVPHFSRSLREVGSQLVPHISSAKPSHIWQRRFYDFNVWTEAKRIEKLRYIHRNPVTRGLVEQPEQWPWSSFRSYAYGAAGPLQVNDCHVLKMRLRPVG